MENAIGGAGLGAKITASLAKKLVNSAMKSVDGVINSKNEKEKEKHIKELLSIANNTLISLGAKFLNDDDGKVFTFVKETLKEAIK